MPQVTLCRKGDPSENAFKIKNGTVYISRDQLEFEPIEEKSLVVGTLELFLATDGTNIPPRIFDIRVISEETPEKVAFESVQQALTIFEGGYVLNKFLAHLIVQSNNVLRKVTQAEQWRNYEHLARSSAEIVRTLKELRDHLSLSSLESDIKTLEGLQPVRYGHLLATSKTEMDFLVGEKGSTNAVVRMNAGGVLCRDGETGNGMYVLLEGSVAVSKGKKVLALIDTPGEAFGELSLFLNQKRTATVTVREDASLLHLAPDELRPFHEKRPLFFYELAKTLSKRLKSNLLKIDETQWLTNSTAEKILEDERTNFLEKLRAIKRKGTASEVNQVLRTLEEKYFPRG